MATLKKNKTEESAEHKILAAARKLFTEKGYDAIKTRDIAKEAGINLALLNYYFKSKENLFEIIMMETIDNFFEGITAIVNDEETGFYKKIELLVDFYITRLTDNPDVPLFVLNQAKNNPKSLPLRINLMDTHFMKQFMAKVKSGKVRKMDPGHLILNIVGLTIFPFVARPMIQRARSINNKEYEMLMQERKKMIPKWIEAMLKVK